MAPSEHQENGLKFEIRKIVYLCLGFGSIAVNESL